MGLVKIVCENRRNWSEFLQQQAGFYCILIRTTINQEPIPGSRCTRQEHILDKITHVMNRTDFFKVYCGGGICLSLV